MCFNIAHGPDSLKTVVHKWYPEVKFSFPWVPIVLIGTHVDQRYDMDTIRKLAETMSAPVKREEGIFCANAIGAVGYFEFCTLRNRYSVASIIQATARATMHMPLVKSMYY